MEWQVIIFTMFGKEERDLSMSYRALEADKIGGVILWDGGNNDWLFFRQHYMVVAADAMRPGLEISAYLGEVNVKMADAVIITGYWHRGGYGMVAIATFLPSVAATR
jgi:hypothetical protein